MFKLLRQFKATFEGNIYRHRNANLGNRIADYVYEDIHSVDRSEIYVRRVEEGSRVLNPKNISPGIKGRRGDGSFGEIVPGVVSRTWPGFVVPRGPTANVEMGTEVKILAKSMIKQIDRVNGDLEKQARQFKRKSPGAITIGLVGINWAKSYTSYEKDRSYTTDGKDQPNPYKEAGEAERRLIGEAADAYDEFLVLRFDASNRPPYPFKWVDEAKLREAYGALIVRVSRLYEDRFRK